MTYIVFSIDLLSEHSIVLLSEHISMNIAAPGEDIKRDLQILNPQTCLHLSSQHTYLSNQSEAKLNPIAYI
mgnify:CR=1 FL=1